MEGIGRILERIMGRLTRADTCGRTAMDGVLADSMHNRSIGDESDILRSPRIKNGAPDQLGDLGDNRVTEGVDSISLHFNGNPIAISYADATSDQCRPFVSICVAIDGECRRIALKCAVVRDTSLQSRAAGVGNDPDAISDVSGTNGRSWYAVPLRIIPDRGQVSENSAEPFTVVVTWSRKQPCNVLHERESGLYLANKASVFRPQAGSCALQPTTKAGIRNVLAGESSADDIHRNSVCKQSLGIKGPDIVVTRNLWPVLSQDATCEGLDLAECHSLKPAGAFKSKTEPADPTEQVEDPQHPPHLEKSRPVIAKSGRSPAAVEGGRTSKTAHVTPGGKGDGWRHETPAMGVERSSNSAPPPVCDAARLASGPLLNCSTINALQQPNAPDLRLHSTNTPTNRAGDLDPRPIILGHVADCLPVIVGQRAAQWGEDVLHLSRQLRIERDLAPRHTLHRDDATGLARRLQFRHLIGWYRVEPVARLHRDYFEPVGCEVTDGRCMLTGLDRAASEGFGGHSPTHRQRLTMTSTDTMADPTVATTKPTRDSGTIATGRDVS